MKVIHECKGLKMLIEYGVVERFYENIDNKGIIITYNLRKRDSNIPIMIKFCPCCGIKIQNVLNMPDGKCEEHIVDISD